MARKTSIPERTKKWKKAPPQTGRPHAPHSTQTARGESIPDQEPQLAAMDRPTAAPSSVGRDHSTLSAGAGLTSSSLLTPGYETMVQEAAYFIAEKKNFQIGLDLENWLEAEKQIRKHLH